MKTLFAVCLCFLLCVPALTAKQSNSATQARSWRIPMKGWATYYNRESCSKEGTGGKDILMANGKPLDDSVMTCAMWTRGRPSGKGYRVTNCANGKTAIVRWTDKGPGRKARLRKVVIDLTPAAMRAIAGEAGILAGRIKVKVEKI